MRIATDGGLIALGFPEGVTPRSSGRRGRCEAYFRFYEELNDFLPPDKRKVTFPHRLAPGATLEKWLRDLGVPLEAVELILVDGRSVGFSYVLGEGDRVSVYPVFESFDVSSLVRVRDRPLRQLGFVCDAPLGQLAECLRALGFDVLYSSSWEPAAVRAVSRAQGRAILARGGVLLDRPGVTRGYRVRETTPWRQAVEVLARFDLFGSIAPLSRCVRCNARLEPVSEAVGHRRRGLRARRVGAGRSRQMRKARRRARHLRGRAWRK
jgi:uncharacterized protein with PIN domain